MTAAADRIAELDTQRAGLIHELMGIEHHAHGRRLLNPRYTIDGAEYEAEEATILYRAALYNLDAELETLDAFGSIAHLTGFAWEPGTNANYRAGRNRFLACIVHFTAGACGGDRAVGLRGYFAAYIPREPTCGPGATTFAEMDAVTWHACEWNGLTTSIEFEKANNDVRLTEYQIERGRAAFAELIAGGIAPTYRDTPGDRIPVGGAISGFVTHRSLHENKCDEHYDGLPQDEIDRMLTGSAGPTKGKTPMGARFRSNRGTMYLVDEAANTAYALTPETFYNVAALDEAAEKLNNVRPLPYGRGDWPMPDNVLAGLIKYPAGLTVTPNGAGATVDYAKLATELAPKLAGAIDYAKIAKAVNDDASKRLAD